MALLLVVPNSLAQSAPAENAPALVLGLSSAQVRHLNSEFEDDLQQLDAFGGKRKVDGIARSLERPGPWTLYGRLGIFNFQNQLESERTGMRFSWRRTGPRLTGRVYVGIHRRF